MPPQDWNRIKQVFSAALGVPQEQRAAYLETVCEDRQDIKLAVEELLRAHHDASQTFLEPASLRLATAWLFREGDRVAGRFSVVKPIARGAMGEVYQVYDEKLRLHIALKAIRPELLNDPETIERFKREVLVTRNIAHDSLCRVFDLVEHASGPHAGLPDGTIVPCLTMELLEGESLDEWLTRRRPISTEEALPLIRQIADALQELHDAEVVHRDLKPSNVMLVATDEGTRAVLTDFGLAKPLDDSVFETQVRVAGGAPFFMAPELFHNDRPSKHSDIYALGLLIDEMVTSTRAFSADSLSALLLQKLGDGPAPPSTRSTGMPRAWERTIQRCLAPNPDHRFDNAHDVLDALGGDGSRPHRAGAPRFLQAGRPARRRALYTAVGATLLIGGAAITNPPELTLPTTVVIHPFTNLTQKKEFDYLATGTTGELGRRLSRVRGLRVYSPSAADANAAVDRTSPVTYSVRGHIQEVGGLLRITVELMDGVNGPLRWSERVDGASSQALQIEDQLAAETVGALAKLPAPETANPLRRAAAALLSFAPRPNPQVPSAGTTSNVAFDYYLRGRTLFEDRTEASALQAIVYLQRALKEDPNFAAAYATLADVTSVLMDLHYDSQVKLIAEAERYVNQAVVLGPDVPEVQSTLGLVRQMQWRWKDAEQAYLRAIELHPTFARAHRWYGGLLLEFGQFDKSLELHRHALELDPYDYGNQNAYGHALFNAGRPKEAVTHLEQLLARKDFFYAHTNIGQYYAFLSGTDPDPARRTDYFNKALAQADIVRKQQTEAKPDADGFVRSDYADLIAALAWGYQGKLDQARPFIDRLTADRAATGKVTAGFLARAYVAQKDHARTLQYLLESEADHEREIYYINVSPFYAGLHDDPQFRALVERVGLSR